MNRTEMKFLKNLRDAPPEGLPWSRLPVSCQNLLARLHACGAVHVVPGQQGKRLRVANPEAFRKIIDTSSPYGLDSLESSPESRADAVEQLGDAKAVGAGNVQGVFIRTTKPNVTMRRVGTIEMLDVAALTRLAGGAAIKLDAGMEWGFSGTIATIENEEAFWRHDLVLPEVDLAIYVRGKMSGRLLNWLGSASMANCHITHWGDYDPVGVLEYVRLRRACPERVQLYVPEKLEQLLKHYGKRCLVQADGQTKALCSLRSLIADPTVARLVHFFDQYGKGLEQEILLGLEKHRSA